MTGILDRPFLILFVALIAQWLAAYAGHVLRRRCRALDEGEREDLDNLKAGTLTLLALIIGFSFSMAVSRYDQRKNYEEAEANAIGTEFARADLLPAEDAAKLRELLRKYTEDRIRFYLTRDQRKIDADTAKLQTQLWSAVVQPAATQPTPIMALAVAGMNDVLNSQGYTQASWWNRIPITAWTLMGLLAIFCNLLLGYGARRTSPLALMILPLVISIPLFLISDIDSPEAGLIHVFPQNLIAQLQSMGPR